MPRPLGRPPQNQKFQADNNQEPEIKQEPEMKQGQEQSVFGNKQLLEIIEENKKLSQQLKETQDKLTEQSDQSVDRSQYEELKAQIDGLYRQLSVQATNAVIGAKVSIYKPIPPSDYQDDAIVFTARNIYYIIGSDRGKSGQIILPPYRLIVFEYAASDIVKDGKEEQQKNFCTFTTNLKAEISFLRNHYLYNITFFENVNETMNLDMSEHDQRALAANAVSQMGPDAIMREAARRKSQFPNFGSKSIEELRVGLTHIIGDEYVKAYRENESARAKRMVMPVVSKEPAEMTDQ